MWLASEKFIPQLLMVEEKANICTYLLKQVDMEENVLKLIDMGDETLVCGNSFKQSNTLHNGSQNVAQNKKRKESDTADCI
jgi:hypothetical protein